MIWYLHITAEIPSTEINKSTSLKFFITPYFSENHLSAVEMYLSIQFELKEKIHTGKLLMKFCKKAGYQQRHWHVKSMSRTHECGIATDMVVGDRMKDFTKN